MPITINVGLSKKVGTANFGSIGANCNVNFEATHDLLEDDLDGFHQKVKNAFVACRQAVQDELAREQAGAAANGHTTASNGNGQHNGNGHTANNGNGRTKPNGRKATASQVRAIHAIASRQGLDLASTLQERFGIDYPEDLAIGQASELIDSLKGSTNGSSNGRRT